MMCREVSVASSKDPAKKEAAPTTTTITPKGHKRDRQIITTPK